jgi:hypothetical protein
MGVRSTRVSSRLRRGDTKAVVVRVEEGRDLRLCRRINIANMARRMRTARPPITAPAIKPVDGEEDLEEMTGAEDEVSSAADWEASVVLKLVVDGSVDSVGALVLALDAASDVARFVRDVVAAGLAADDVRAADETGMLGILGILGMLGIDVGILTPSLERRDATTPPMFDIMSPICRRSCWYSPCSVDLSMLPAATQASSALDCAALRRSVYDVRLATWLS